MDTAVHQDLRDGEIVRFPDYLQVQLLEEAFGVLLPDAELAQTKTLVDLYRLILIELKTQPAPSPAQPFLHLRQILQNWVPPKRLTLRPSTPLTTLFPANTRIEEWKRLATLTGYPLPPLRPYRWLRDSIRIATTLVTSAVFVVMVLFTRPNGLLWFPPLLLAGFAGLVTYRSLFVATQPLVLEFPFRSLGELAQDLIEKFPEAFSASASASLTPEQVWEQILAIAGHDTATATESPAAPGSA